MPENGQTHFKNVEANAEGFSKCVWPFWDVIHEGVKDTDREKALWNKTPALKKSINLGIWVDGTTNELFIKGS